MPEIDPPPPQITPKQQQTNIFPRFKYNALNIYMLLQCHLKGKTKYFALEVNFLKKTCKIPPLTRYVHVKTKTSRYLYTSFKR